MANQALYQKYRSKNFDEVVGQEYIVRSIQNAVREDKVSHAYLFCGPRGTGKTTMARLLAKAINCENPKKAPCGTCKECIAIANGTHPDVVEINAANETGVDSIRELIDRAKLVPMQGKKKVYIIDEVHQLTSAASSALLKILEEPPEHDIFVLATTDPLKLLPTIVSRCQRYDFSKVPKNLIAKHVLMIAKKEGITCSEEAADSIAILADGGMRDALSILDQCISFTGGKVDVASINQIYGLATTQEKMELLKEIFHNNCEGMIQRIRSYEENGIDISHYTKDLMNILKDAVVWNMARKKELLEILDKEQAEDIAANANNTQLLAMVKRLMDAEADYKITNDPNNYFEVACLELSAMVGVEPETVKRVEKPVQKETTQACSVKEEKKAAPVEKAAPKETSKAAPKKEPEKKEPTKKVPEEPVHITTLSSEECLGLLVQCNKKEKEKDISLYQQFKSEPADPNNMRYISALGPAVIGAASKDAILFVTAGEPEANYLNESTFNKNLYFFLKNEVGIDKMPFAMNQDSFKKAAEEFVDRSAKKTLPTPTEIHRYTQRQAKEEQAKKEEAVLGLFGKDMVEIIDKKESD